MIKKIAIMPHPPVLIPEIGKNEWHKVRKTYEAMEKVAQEFVDEKINKVLVISPHGPAYSRIVAVNIEEQLKGDLSDFNYPKKYIFSNIMDFSEDLVNNGFYSLKATLDHGALVPLYFFKKTNPGIEVVSISTGFMGMKELEKMGKVIGKLLNNNDKYKNEDYGIIVSSDLSHRLKEESYYGFSEEGPVFDKMVYEKIKEGKLEEIKNIPLNIVDGAGQCGFIPLVFLSYILSGLRVKTIVLNYEGPFGVGYLVGKGDVFYD